MEEKVSYKVQNWSQYNRSLINRGNITVWFSEEALNSWYDSDAPSGKGRPRVYSDECIELGLVIRSLFNFPLRATQGFLEGMLELLGIDLLVPCYTSLSRRASKLNVQLNTALKKEKPLNLVIDSTGLKIYGEGEWKTRIHGKQKRRSWRKLHVAVNPESHEIISMELTTAKNTDDQMLPKLIEELDYLGSIYADGAYISETSFESMAKKGASPRIPLRSGTSLAKNPKNKPGLALRNQLVHEIWEAGGRVNWKKSSDYHRRSLVETCMMRIKKIFSGSLSSRKYENQIIEARLKSAMLNRMTALGMPQTIAVIG